MLHSSRKNIFFISIVAFVCMLAASVYGSIFYMECKRQACVANDDLLRTKKAITKIKNTIEISSQNREEKDDKKKISFSVETAARFAAITPDRIEGVYPGSPRKIENSYYYEIPTEIPLREISMPQTIKFLHQLTTGPAQFQVKSIQMEAPRNQFVSQNWNVNATLVYYTYQPEKNEKTDKSGD